MLIALGVAVIVPVVQVAVYRFAPMPITLLMIQRLMEGKGMDMRWRPLEQISPRLVDSVIAAEDSGFCDHHGFDFEAMEKAAAANEKRPGKIRGGSTISQQTAKNVFLWPGRSYVRKGLEAGYTALIELGWGKRRIMEAYLNVVEFGPGIYGAEAASQRYFHVPAAKLSQEQASRLAAILPSPLKWRAVRPGRYVAKRTVRIVKGAAAVRGNELSSCVLD
jgi:monofunctional biosynthetic peptidoglycan transglycosylase